MPLNADRRLPSPSELFEQANEALKQRRDIPRDVVDGAWSIGPLAVIALANTYPTPDDISEAERETQRQLRMKEVRRVCSLALEARKCIEGNIERMDDSTRRDVAVLVGEFRKRVFVLAEWAVKDSRGEVVSAHEWHVVRKSAELPQIKELLHKTHSAIQSAIAESHVPRGRRRKRA